jgi:hypothetical protein
MKLEHPESKVKVETENPESYLSQGWTEVGKKSADDEDDKK